MSPRSVSQALAAFLQSDSVNLSSIPPPEGTRAREVGKVGAEDGPVSRFGPGSLFREMVSGWDDDGSRALGGASRWNSFPRKRDQEEKPKATSVAVKMHKGPQPGLETLPTGKGVAKGAEGGPGGSIWEDFLRCPQREAAGQVRFSLAADDNCLPRGEEKQLPARDEREANRGDLIQTSRSRRSDPSSMKEIRDCTLFAKQSKPREKERGPLKQGGLKTLAGASLGFSVAEEHVGSTVRVSCPLCLEVVERSTVGEEAGGAANPLALHLCVQHEALVCMECASLGRGQARFVSFLEESKLKAHRESCHRPCRCSECGLQLSGKDSLRPHFSRFHGKQTPYVCLCERCGLAFASPGELSRHLTQVHLPKAPLQGLWGASRNAVELHPKNGSSLA